MMRRGVRKVGIDPDALVGLMSCGGARVHCHICRGARASLIVASMVLIGMQYCCFVSSVFLAAGIVVDAEVTSLGGVVMDAGLLQGQLGKSAGEEGVRTGEHSARQ
eukprot:COSAG01_NODE_3348_length_6224_cov_43.028245_1_plen_106_part_00